MSGNKSTKRTQAVLELNWGSSGSKKGPFSGSSRGISVKRAKDAGVTRDHPLTEMAQDLAKGLADDERARQKALDPRGNFQKKYDIRDEAAHVSPERFRDVFVSSYVLDKLRDLVTIIYIEDGHGLAATFTFKNGADHPDLKRVPSQVIISSGVAGGLALMKGANQAIIRSDSNRDIGILELQSVPDPLTHHAGHIFSDKASGGYSSLIASSPNEYLFNIGNFTARFSNAVKLQVLLEEYCEKGVEITMDAYRAQKDGPFKLGTLWPLTKVQRSAYGLPHKDFSAFKLQETTYSISRGEGESLALFFNHQAGVVITLKGTPFAVLLRNDLPDRVTSELLRHKLGG